MKVTLLAGTTDAEHKIRAAQAQQREEERQAEAVGQPCESEVLETLLIAVRLRRKLNKNQVEDPRGLFDAVRCGLRAG